MPISNDMIRYPICDADIWIKGCKLQKEEEFFNIYNKLFFSDAVIQELKNKKNDNPNVFKIGYDSLKKYESSYYKLSFKDTEYFNAKERKIVKRLFAKNKINYNEQNFEFERDKHVGEKVSLIYASIHNLDIMLSDDNDSKIFKEYIKNKFKTVKVINLIDFLIQIGIDADQAEEIRHNVSKSYKQIEAENQILNKGTLNNLNLLKEGLRIKGKLL